MSLRELMTGKVSRTTFSHLLIASTIGFAVCSQSANGVGPVGPCCYAAAATGQVRSLTDRRTADALLKRSRQAVADGNVELAEWYLTRAEALNVKYDSVFQRFVDTPVKVREAIVALKKNPAAANVGKQPAITKVGPKQIPADQLVEQIAKGQTPGPSTRSTAETKQKASGYLQNGRLALAEGDINKALDWYKSALATGAEFGPDEYSPAALASALKSYEALPAERPVVATQPTNNAKSIPDEPVRLVDPAMLKRPKTINLAQVPQDKVDSISLLNRGTKIQNNNRPATVRASHNAPITPRVNQDASTSANQKIQRDRVEALRLLSKAKVAADQGDLKLAEKFARTAQNLKVPDSAYQRGDTRPWMVLMDIGRKQDRVSAYDDSQIAKGIAAPPLPTGTQPAPRRYPVDNSRTVLASAEVPIDEPVTNSITNAVNNAARNVTGQVANRASNVAQRASQRVAQALDSVPGIPNLTPPAIDVVPPGVSVNSASSLPSITSALPEINMPDLSTLGPPPTPPSLVVPETQSVTVPKVPDFSPMATSQDIYATPEVTKSITPAVSRPVVQSRPTTAPTLPEPSVAVPHPSMSAVTLPQVPPPTVSTTPAATRTPVVLTPKRTTPSAKSMLAEDLMGPATSTTPPTDVVANGISDYTSSLMDDVSNGAFSSTINDPVYKVEVPRFDVPRVIESTPVASTAPAPTPSPTPAPQLVIEAPESDLQPIPESLPVVDSAPVAESQLPPIVSAPIEIPLLPRSQPEIDVPSPSSSGQYSTGESLFRRGMQALSNRNVTEARSLFVEAWKYESELAPQVRQQLQDQLQVARPDVAKSPGEPATLKNKDEEQVRKLVTEMSRQQAAINAIRENDPMKAWELIKQLRLTVAESEVPDATRRRLLDRVDRASRNMESYISTNRGRIENDQRNKQVLAEVDRMREQRLRDQQQLAELVDQFQQLLDEQRFPEAKIVAKRAAEIDPHNQVVVSMLWKSQVANQVMNRIVRSERFESGAAAMLQAVDDSGVPPENDFEFPDVRYWEDMTKRRGEALARNRRKFTETEQEIYQALKQQVDVQFEEMALSEIMEKLSQVSGINIFMDPEGLTAEGVTSNTLVSLNLRKPVSLKSALNLILQPLHLSYVVQDEVLQVTSEQVRNGDVEPQVYNVADLVIPIPNFAPGTERGLPSALREGYNMINSVGYQGGYRTMPLTVDNNQGAGGNSSVLAQMGIAATGGGGVRTGIPQQPAFGPQGGGAGGAALADFDTLIELITTTVAPETWEEVGGTGSIASFPTNLSLVVAQTQEVHEKIVDLLAQLRRLQDLQVTIEVRFITLNDDFFERIGVDFDFDIDDNTGLSTVDITNLDDSGPSVTVGLDPTGVPRVDLDVGFQQGTFGSTQPIFGGFDAGSAASLGFAILSDIEAFFVIEAAQGDTRTNVLQAPKVTLFNGQNATVSDQSQQPFVTSIIPVVGDFAAAHQPVITVLTEGTSLSVQAVVSQDRRFVRLTLVPFFSQIRDVDTFTFDGTNNSDTGTNVVDPTDDTNTLIDNAQAASTGTTVQLPTFAFTSVSTTVSVPDGGTILLGGIKRLQEGRIERGVPMLSKLPYINRLFKNVGIGRETQSLMMMVTPRIIIQEEEEEKLGLNLP